MADENKTQQEAEAEGRASRQMCGRGATRGNTATSWAKQEANGRWSHRGNVTQQCVKRWWCQQEYRRQRQCEEMQRDN
jgi:hypothetical protein